MPKVDLRSGAGIDRSLRLAAPILAGLGLLAAAPASLAAPAVKPSVPAGFTISKIATAPKGATNCDDLTFLDGHLYMGCQNKALSNGGGGNSTLAEFGPDGSLVKTWSIKDKIDGLGGDPLHHRLIITLDEDANSHLATIDDATGQITNYSYSPDPRGSSTPVTLRTGGGTDNVSVDSAGHILITGSHAGTKTGTAVFKVTLTPPASAARTGTATLAPTFLDDATAVSGTSPGTQVKLSLGDVDSGTIVPQSSPRFGGSYVIDDQTALELVFANNILGGTGLTVLKTPFGLDDIRWTTSDAGALYVVNNGGTVPGASSIYKVTGPFKKNTVLASNDGVGDQVVTVNLRSGALTPFIRHLTTTKGLVYLDPSGTQTELPLNGATATPVSSTKPSTGTTTTSTQKSSSSNTALIVIIIVVVLALLGGGGYALSRRRQTP
jgi:hypothetical protein